MVSEELEKSLREEINSYIASRLSSLQEEIAQLLQRSANQPDADASIISSIGEHLRAAHERGIEQAASESSRAQAASDVARLKSAVADIDDQRTQVDILNALVNRSSSFAPRVAFFVIKNDQAMGWRARGLEGTVGDDAVREISLPTNADSALNEAVRSRATWSGSPGSHAEDHLLLGKLGSEPPQRMAAIPLVIRAQSVAVLYADSAGLDSDAINLEALETLVRVAGMAVELLAVTRDADAAAQPAQAEAQAPAPEERRVEEPQAAEEMPTAEIVAAPIETVEVEPEAEVEEEAFVESAQPVEAEPQIVQPVEEEEAAVSEPPSVEEEKGVAPFVASTPEPVMEQPSPSKAEADWSDLAGQSGTQPTTSWSDLPGEGGAQPEATPPSQYVAPLGGARRYGRSAEADLPIEVSDDEKRLHQDARRFARLLVSEIKLYNEQKVREGRSQGDIYERLREDIDRSRQMYDKRVAPPVATRYDYFHQELVNTLAEGDPSKLGSSYPGATVSA